VAKSRRSRLESKVAPAEKVTITPSAAELPRRAPTPAPFRSTSRVLKRTPAPAEEKPVLPTPQPKVKAETKPTLSAPQPKPRAGARPVLPTPRLRSKAEAKPVLPKSQLKAKAESKPTLPTPQPKVRAEAKPALPKPRPKAKAEAKPALPTPRPKAKAEVKPALPTPRLRSKAEAKPALPTPRPKAKAESKPVVRPPRVRKPLPSILLEGDEQGAVPFSGPGQKFELGSALPDRPAMEEPELPEAYGTGKLLLTCRDPHSLYACWDFTDQEQRHFNLLSADHHLVLRIYLKAIAGKPVAQVHLHPESRHWFVSVDGPGKTYVVELGYFRPDGQFRTLAVSAPVITPRDRPSEETKVEFTTIRKDLPQAAPQPISIGEPAAPTARAPQATVAPLQLVDEATTGRPVPREEPQAVSQRQPHGTAPGPTAPPTYQACPDLQVGIGLPVAPQPQVAAGIATEWGPEQEKLLEQLITSAWLRQEWIGSLQFSDLVNAVDSLKSGPGSREWPAQALETSSLAWAQAENVSSPSPAAPAQGRGFWFNVNAELVIYGATEPDATITIGGRVVRIQPDGSFSFRFSLPDGNYCLPITAESTDGEQRKAELKFARETHYLGTVEAHPQDPALKPPTPDHLG
jgi:uncharacterized protein